MKRFSDTDLAEVATWYAARGLKAPTLDMLSSYGVIVHGVAAGWLFRTDSTFALLDGFISNRLASYEDRAVAFDAIVADLLAEAERTGFRRVLAYTRSGSIERLAVRSGFRCHGACIAYERGT